ncbi:hypothetical protein D6D13_10615 [Aureobasidium pullulans]|uniref:Uncharacterized protein n=1 Tax=Aureobasidium pullulans TaxID=5580 RepID=A0A4S9BZJ9_AURPU|nr:hypothetical protein D6D13_10615 [Aureobasidium pullulans]
METLEEVDDSSYATMPPIITETGFIIPASARPIIEALARRSGSHRFLQRTAIRRDALAKSSIGISQEGSQADTEKFMYHAPTEVCPRQHLSPSPYDSMPFSSGIKANHCTTDIQNVQLSNLSTTPWMAQTAWISEHEIVDGPARWASGSFIGIRSRARAMIAKTAAIESIIGPTSLHRLLDSRVRDPDLQCNVSDWAQDFISNFPHMVPGWCRPSPSEMFCPHMPIIICLAWPELRRHFVEHASDADWVEAVMGSISVSWPYGDRMVFRTEVGGALGMSDAFEAWINDGSNWSLSATSAKGMIGVEGRARIRDAGER